jgi:CHAD domain-containing protein
MRLARGGIALRRRLERRRVSWRLTLPDRGGRLDVSVADHASSPPSALRDLLVARLRGRRLGVRATVLTRRVAVHLRDRQGPVADVALDANTVTVGGRRQRRIHQIEVEPRRDDGTALAPVLGALREAGAIDAEECPELLAALDEAPPAPPVRPRPDAPAPHHVGSAIRTQVDLVLAHDPATRLGSDPEALHEMRVATRRLRAYLRAARPMFERAWVDGVRAELSWLRHMLGAVRDVDVFLAYLRAEAATLEGRDRQAIRRVLGRLPAERDAARAELGEALQSARYLALLDQLDEMVRRTPLSESTVDLRRLVAKEFKKLKRAVDALDAPPGARALHAVRIRGKRARYAAELAEAMIGRRATRFLRAAKAFQDVLGEYQDAVVIEERLSRLVAAAAGPRASFAVGRLAERQRARRAAALARFRPAWRRLHRRAEKVTS